MAKLKNKCKTKLSKPNSSCTSKCTNVKTGKGFINSVINKIPFEMHIPGYRYCGPGTKLDKRLQRGDVGINKLDEACKEHDIAYSTNNNNIKNLADKKLISTAWQRFKARDASIGEKSSALAVTGLMKMKNGVEKISGGGRIASKTKRNSRKKKNLLDEAICKAKTSLKKIDYNDVKGAAQIALRAAKSAIKQKKSTQKPFKFRVIPVPKTGGALPFLIPLFAGLSAVGSLAGGTAAVVNAVNSTKNAKKQLNENERHNKMMEAIAIGKNGKKNGDGLYLKPYKNGFGLYLKPQSKNF